MNEETGDLIQLVNDLSDGEGFTTALECFEATKDCDFWRTSSFDAANHILYIQVRDYDTFTANSSSYTMRKLLHPLCMLSPSYDATYHDTPHSQHAVAQH